MPTQVLCSLLPMQFARSKEDVLVIGLASGITAGALTTLPDLERLEIVELEPAIQRAAVSASCCEESMFDSPGAISGRHFRQGLKAAASACARVSKKRQFSRRGVRTRHTGRQ